jgi:hypothetical protein
VEETGVPGENINMQQVTDKRNVVHLAPSRSRT